MSRITIIKVLAILIVFSLIKIHPQAHSQIVYPTPRYNYSPITPRVGDVIIFDASEYEKEWNQTGQSTLLPTTWYFGDGETATGTIVNHTYTNPGIYGVGVIAKDDRGYGGTSEKSINIREQTPVTVNIALSDRVIKTGQKATISGNLIYNGSGVPKEWITLSSTTYPFNQWKEIATVKTDELGRYSYDWKAFYGYYHVKAIWKGNSTYPESSVSVVLIAETFGDLINEFYSNSTITGMNYNGTSRILKFSAEGPSGTTGYTKIHIREDEKFDPDRVNVLFDGQPIEYKITASDQIWILEFTYTHSIHDIEVNFDKYSTFTTITPESIPVIISVLVLLIAALILGIFVYFKRGKPR